RPDLAQSIGDAAAHVFFWVFEGLDERRHGVLGARAELRQRLSRYLALDAVLVLEALDERLDVAGADRPRAHKQKNANADRRCLHGCAAFERRRSTPQDSNGAIAQSQQ